MTKSPAKIRLAVAATGQVDLRNLVEAASADGWEILRADSMVKLASLAESGNCDAVIVASDPPTELPRAPIQDLLGLVHDVVVMLLLPRGCNTANCPAIVGATSDQIWDLQTPPQELLAAIRYEVQCARSNRPEYHVLCADDDVEFLASLKRLLIPAAQNAFPQFTLDFSFVSSPAEALACVQAMDKPMAVVVCDQVMPQMQGMDLLSMLKEINPATRRVLLTGYAGLESAVRAINEQLLDNYLTKPVEDPTEFINVIVHQAHEYHLRCLSALHRRRIMAQFEFIQTVTGAESLEMVLNTTTSFLMRLLSAPWAALFLRENGQSSLRSTAGKAPQSSAAIGQAWKDHVRTCGRCQRLPDVIQHCFTEDSVASDQPPAHASTVAPLLVRQDLLGGLLVGADRPGQSLNRDDRLLATFVADIAALSIMRFRDHEALESTYVGTMTSLMETVEAKDPYTRGHTDRVVNLALALGKAAGVNPEGLKDIRYAAALHDLGKLAVPEDILHKPADLSPQEEAIVREHPGRADAILKHLRFLDTARLIIRSHHERFDGQGYPCRLTGEEIPLGARILAIVDSYDAMTSSRPYRKTMTVAQALTEIRAGAGTQFDPALAALFVEMIQSQGKTQRTRPLDGSRESAEVQRS